MIVSALYLKTVYVFAFCVIYKLRKIPREHEKNVEKFKWAHGM